MTVWFGMRRGAMARVGLGLVPSLLVLVCVCASSPLAVAANTDANTDASTDANTRPTVLLQGTEMERLLQLCQAVASAPPSRPLSFMWAPHPQSAALEDLFSLPSNWGISVSTPSLIPGRMKAARGAPISRPDSPEACLRQVGPSPSLLVLLRKEDVRKAEASIGVLVEPWSEGMACPGCPGATGLRLCMLRHVAALFLRDPTADALLTSARPADARNVSLTFHESRRPWEPRALQERLSLGCAAGPASNPTCSQLYVVDLFLLSLTRGLLHSSPSPSAAFIVALSSLEPGGAPWHVALGVGNRTPAETTPRNNENRSQRRRSVEGSGADGSALGGSGGGGSSNGGDAGSGPVVAPAPWALPWIPPLADPGNDLTSASGSQDLTSGTETQYGLTGTEGAERTQGASRRGRRTFGPMCMCQLAPLPQLADYPHARNTIVDEELGVVYCAVEKAACTSLKMLLRSLKGLPDAGDYTRAHLMEHSGLKYLWPHYRSNRLDPAREAQGIRAMTRRDFFKFTFVRNPFGRILSAFLDKHDMGSTLGHSHGDLTKGGGEDALGRAAWNRHMFGSTFVQTMVVDKLSGLSWQGLPWAQRLSFRQFVHLAAITANYKHANGLSMDPHLANQTDLCRLSAIRYNLVGRLDSLHQDSTMLLRILTRHTGRNASAHGHMFGFGHSVHRTQADLQLKAYYDKVAARIVARLYRVDFDLLLQNTHFPVPLPLAPFLSNNLV